MCFFHSAGVPATARTLREMLQPRRTAPSSAMDVSTSSCFTAYDARLDRRLVCALRLHERCTHHRGCARRRIGKKGSVPRGTRKWNTTVFHRIPNAPGIRGIRIPFRVFTRIHHVGPPPRAERSALSPSRSAPYPSQSPTAREYRRAHIDTRRQTGTAVCETAPKTEYKVGGAGMGG